MTVMNIGVGEGGHDGEAKQTSKKMDNYTFYLSFYELIYNYKIIL